jgi:hypothetical protein
VFILLLRAGECCPSSTISKSFIGAIHLDLDITQLVIASSYIGRCPLLICSTAHPLNHPNGHNNQDSSSAQLHQADHHTQWLSFATHLFGNGSQLQSTWTRNQKQPNQIHKSSQTRKTPLLPKPLKKPQLTHPEHHGSRANDENASAPSSAALSSSSH